MFILLTRHTDGGDVFINVDRIESIASENNVTKVWFTELDYWEVKETPEHIMNLIKHK